MSVEHEPLQPDDAPVAEGRAGRRKAARKRRGARRAVIALIALAVAVILWIWVFPWVDAEYINDPNIGL